jgi:hypothetical protein
MQKKVADVVKRDETRRERDRKKEERRGEGEIKREKKDNKIQPNKASSSHEN